FPARACEEVQRSGYEGPLYNSFDWGGYLSWRLCRDGKLRVSIDGRTNLHGEERIRRALETWAGRKGWRDDPGVAAARLVVVGATAALGEVLRLESQFKRVYEDDLAVVFVRRGE